METANLNQYQQARANGIIGERVVENLLDCTVDTNALIDVFVGLDVPLEVKTCVRWSRSAHTTTGRRRGRFTLLPEQHRRLLSNNGYYAFCLLDDCDIVKIKVVRATEVFHPALFDDTQHRVSINWKHIFGREEPE